MGLPRYNDRAPEFPSGRRQPTSAPL